MADTESEQLAISIVGDGKSADTMLQSLCDGLNKLTQGCSRAISNWTKFADLVNSKTDAALSKVNSGIESVNAALLQTDAALAPVVHTLNEFTGSLKSGSVAGKEFASSAEKVATAAKAANAATDSSTASIRTLSLQYRAGETDLKGYVSGLQAIAKAAVAGSEAELLALAKIREARDAARREARKDAAQKDRDVLKNARAQTRDQRNIAGALTSVGGTLTANVTAPVLMGGHDAVQAASDLEASQARVKTIFGDSAAAIGKWGDTAEQAFAMSKREALSSAAGLGEVLTELGLGKSKAADMSEGVVELSAKFAAMKGTTPEAALKAFTSGLTGRGTSALRQYGIDLSANAIKQEALRLGYVKMTQDSEKLALARRAVGEAEARLASAKEKHGGDESNDSVAHAQDAVTKAQERLAKASAGTADALTPAIKAQAAYAILAEHSSSASAGFAAASNTEAIAHKRLQAALENVAAAYGQALLPALAAGEKWLAKVLNALEHLSPAAKDTLLVIAALAAGVGPLATAMGVLVNGFLLWSRASEFLSTIPTLLTNVATSFGIVVEEGAAAGPALLAALGPVGWIIAAIVAAVALLVAAWRGDWGHIREVVAGIVEWMRPYFSQFTGWLSGVWQSISARVTRVWNDIAPIVRTALGVVVGIIKTDLSLIVTFWETWGQAIWGVVRAAWAVISGIVKYALDAMEGGFRLALDLITGSWSKFWHDLGSTASTLWGDVKGTLEGIWGSLADGFHKTILSMEAWWVGFWTKIKQGDLAGAIDAGNDAAAKAHGGQTLGEAMAGNAPHPTAAAAKKTATGAGTGNGKGNGGDGIPHFNNGNGGGGGGGYKPDLPMPSLGDLEPLEALVGSNPLDAKTTASNYAAQVSALKDAFAEQQLAAMKSGNGSYDADAMKRQELGHSLNLNSNAANNTKAAIADLLPVTDQAQKKLLALRKELNALRSEMSGRKQTDAQKRQYSALQGQYNTAKATLDADKKTLEENRRVYSEAINAKAEDARALMQMNADALAKNRAAWLEGQKASLAQGLAQPGSTGSQSRDQYDAQLKAAIARITAENGPNSPDLKQFRAALDESVKARETANKEVQSAVARLRKNDFDLKQGEIDAEAARRSANGEDAGSVGDWKKAATGQNDRARFSHDFAAADEQQKAAIDDGSESLQQYQVFLKQMRDAAVAAFGEADIAVAKLNRDIDHNGWAIVAQQAEEAKAAYDAGGVSIDQYRAELVTLRSTLAATSPEFKRLTGEIESLDLAKLQQEGQAAKEAFESGAIPVEAYRQRLLSLRSEVAAGSAAYKTFTQEVLDLDKHIVDSARQTAGEIGSRFADVFEKIVQNVNGARATVRNFAKELGADILKRNVQSAASKVAFKAESSSDPKVAAAKHEIEAAQTQTTAAAQMNAAADKQLQAAQQMNGQGGGGAGSGAGVAGAAVTAGTGSAGSSGTAGAIGKGIGVAADVAGAAKGGSGALGDATSAVETAAKSGWLGKAMGTAVPYIGAALAGYSLLSGLFGGHSKPDYTTHTSDSAASALGRGDHSGLFDSGLSGSASLRSLLSQNSARTAAAQQSANSSPLPSHTFNITIHQQPGENGYDLVRQVKDSLTRDNSLQDALTPTSTSNF